MTGAMEAPACSGASAPFNGCAERAAVVAGGFFWGLSGPQPPGCPPRGAVGSSEGDSDITNDWKSWVAAFQRR